jgi:hypothetical protein
MIGTGPTNGELRSGVLRSPEFVQEEKTGIKTIEQNSSFESPFERRREDAFKG